VEVLHNRSIGLWGAAFVCWISDRFFCEFWAGLGFPYLHGAWHILIFLASYTAVVLFAYFDVKQHRPGLVPDLRYYPEMVFDLGIPYIVVSAGQNNGKDV